MRQFAVETAYVFFARGYRPGKTPTASVEAHVLAIVRRWNARIPGRAVRRLTDLRFREAADTLRVWSVAEVLAGIDHYSAQKWQKTHRAWKRFEAWIGLDVCTEWCEAALTAAEHAASGGPPIDDRVETLVRETAAGARIQSENDELLSRFAEYSPDEQAELLRQAVAELHSLPARRRANRPLAADLACFPVRMQLLVILKRRQQQQQQHLTAEAAENTENNSSRGGNV